MRALHVVILAAGALVACSGSDSVCAAVVVVPAPHVEPVEPAPHVPYVPVAPPAHPASPCASPSSRP